LLHEPVLEEAVGLLGTPGPAGLRTEWLRPQVVSGERLAILHLPTRRATREVERRVFVALVNGQGLRVKYTSVSSDQTSWRILRPGAMAWDGRRWHVRAWCENRQEWRDFVLGRISAAEWPFSENGELPVDEDWNFWETLQLRINPRLGEQARAALQMDYGLTGETLEIRVRRAMKGYLLAELFIADKDSPELPPHFVKEG
jgi:predicted DNA-binding transcriptional regulator YafY